MLLLTDKFWRPCNQYASKINLCAPHFLLSRAVRDVDFHIIVKINDNLSVQGGRRLMCPHARQPHHIKAEMVHILSNRSLVIDTSVCVVCDILVGPLSPFFFLKF